MVDGYGTPQNEIQGSELRGKTVIDRSGTNFGEVNDIALDPQSWRVTGLVIDVTKEVADRLHLDKPMMGSARLVVSSERIDTIGDNVMLNMSASDVGAFLGRQG